MATPGPWCSVYSMLYDVIRLLSSFAVQLLLFVCVTVKQTAVTLYSRYAFTRILQTAHFDCCTVWLLVGQHVGWQTVGRQTVSKFSWDENSQATASCSSRRPPNVTLPPPAHLPIIPTNPPAILIIQEILMYDEMNSENDSRFVQLNV